MVRDGDSGDWRWPCNQVPGRRNGVRRRPGDILLRPDGRGCVHGGSGRGGAPAALTAAASGALDQRPRDGCHRRRRPGDDDRRVAAAARCRGRLCSDGHLRPLKSGAGAAGGRCAAATGERRDRPPVPDGHVQSTTRPGPSRRPDGPAAEASNRAGSAAGAARPTTGTAGSTPRSSTPCPGSSSRARARASSIPSSASVRAEPTWVTIR